MSDSAWWKSGVIYQLYVDKFAGNLAGLTAKLDYFTDLGINAIWILPHYPSPGVDDGYDISDYESVRSDLGSLEDFDRFVTAAHDRGLKVITDLVLNHTSSAHSWFIESRSSKDNPRRNWYLWNDNRDKFSQAFVHFSDTKEKNWIWNEATGDYYYATFYSQQPDLNWDNPEVFAAMQEVIDFWLSRGVDGFRLDAVSRLIKREGTNCFALPETHQVLKQIRSYIDSKYPGVVLMAETGGWPDEAKTFFGSGDECQLVIHFPLSVKLLSAIPSRNLAGVEQVWRQSQPIPENCHWAVFLTSHDTVDVFFLGSDEEKWSLINKANPGGQFSQPDSPSFGARLAEICQGNQEEILWATNQLLSQPGTPIIYYGNEIGMRNALLPEKPRDTRAYVRAPFDWDEARRQQSDPDSLLNQIRAVIQNRRKQI